MTPKEPFIGITCDVDRRKARPGKYELLCDFRYPEAVKQAGGFPVLLPIARRASIVRRCLDAIDGLIIVGGDDVDPGLYGEKPRHGTGTVFPPRLRFERQLYLLARKRKLPIFGICYGMQLINVLEGGTLFQDIQRDARSGLNHRDKKSPLTRVNVDPDSRLGRIVGRRAVRVHCEHHQAVRHVAPKFRPVAFAPDGIVEAIEGGREQVLAVQWHPERTLASRVTQRLFAAFVGWCREKPESSSTKRGRKRVR